MEEDHIHPIRGNVEVSFWDLVRRSKICKREFKAQDPMLVLFVAGHHVANLGPSQMIVPGDCIV